MLPQAVTHPLFSITNAFPLFTTESMTLYECVAIRTVGVSMPVRLFEREAYRTVRPCAVFPMGDDLPGRGTVSDCAGFAGLTRRHVV